MPVVKDRFADLFRQSAILQSSGEALLDALEQDGCTASQRNRFLRELTLTLQSIRDQLAQYPTHIGAKVLADWHLTNVAREGGKKQRPLGPVLVVAPTQRELVSAEGAVAIADHLLADPLAGWATPLSQAIDDGNPAIVLVSRPFPFACTLRLTPLRGRSLQH